MSRGRKPEPTTPPMAEPVPERSPRTDWEHHHVFATVGDFRDVANELGAQRWELVAVVAGEGRSEGYPCSGWWLFFRRPL